MVSTSYSRCIVLGEGPKKAKIMLIGQNPGKEEVRMKRPFVGRAGKYLNKILEKNKINRKKLFITSIVKHSTPKNRKPTLKEIKKDLPILLREIKKIKPKIILSITYQEIQRSPNYKSGFALRFPRFTALRPDKHLSEITSLEEIEKDFKNQKRNYRYG